MHKEGTKGTKSTNLYAYFYVFQLDYTTPLKSPRGDNPSIELLFFIGFRLKLVTPLFLIAIVTSMGQYLLRNLALIKNFINYFNFFNLCSENPNHKSFLFNPQSFIQEMLANITNYGLENFDKRNVSAVLSQCNTS